MNAEAKLAGPSRFDMSAEASTLGSTSERCAVAPSENPRTLLADPDPTTTAEDTLDRRLFSRMPAPSCWTIPVANTAAGVDPNGPPGSPARASMIWSRTDPLLVPVAGPSGVAVPVALAVNVTSTPT